MHHSSVRGTILHLVVILTLTIVSSSSEIYMQNISNNNKEKLLKQQITRGNMKEL